MEQIALGSDGLRVSAQGLGCMGMTAFYCDDPVAAEPEVRFLSTMLDLTYGCPLI